MSDSRLFTPGPLTTDIRVRQAMLRDWGSRDAAFITLTAELRRRLLDVANTVATRAAVRPQVPEVARANQHAAPGQLLTCYVTCRLPA
jgi:hypothetical protein